MPKRETSLRQKCLQRISYFGFVFYGLDILMMETWQELKVTVKREGEELVSNLLIELGTQGVAIEDSFEETVLPYNYVKSTVNAEDYLIVIPYLPKKGCPREFLAYFTLFLKDTAEVGLDSNGLFGSSRSRRICHGMESRSL